MADRRNESPPVVCSRFHRRPVCLQARAADSDPGGTSTNVVNPTHVQFESLDHDTVTVRNRRDRKRGRDSRQTVVAPKASTLVQAGVEAPLKLYPLTPGTYRHRRAALSRRRAGDLAR